jgi:hypothetical protein
MRRLATLLIALYWVSSLGCTLRERRPDGPYREAEEFADALSDEAVACAREHAPAGTGGVAIAAELTGAVPVIRDAASMPGSEPLITCVRTRATAKLRSPAKAPARFVRIRFPIPLVTSKVTYDFTDELGS